MMVLSREISMDLFVRYILAAMKGLGLNWMKTMSGPTNGALAGQNGSRELRF